MSSYATITDLQRYGLPPEAVQGISDPTLQAELDAASTLADSYLRGRYALPLVTYDVELTMNVCWLAAFNIMAARGYNPETGADSIYLDRFNRATQWLRDVQRQQIHPNVTPQPVNDATYGFPQVNTATPRGWGTGGVW
jgi:phage gp36-like protein